MTMCMAGVMAAVLGLATTGCITVPRAVGETSYLSYVGDQASLAMPEVVVAVNLGETHGYANVHVQINAIFSATAVFSNDENTVRDFLWRMQPRLAARAVQVTVETGAGDLALLRNELQAAAQQVFDDALVQWKYRQSYEVQAVVTGLYLTSPDVPPQPIRRW